MTTHSKTEKKLFVLDTNVLMHDPAAIFRFQEHDVFIPMVVLEELDRAKKGRTELARNVRQASRFFDELIQHADQQQIDQGIPLTRLEYSSQIADDCSGRLQFQVKSMSSSLPESLPGDKPDNSILAIAMALHEELDDRQVIVVSKDINLRIKAALLHLVAEDYSSDQVLDDINLLYTGVTELPSDFWQTHGQTLESWQEQGRTFYRVEGPLVKEWSPNQFLYTNEDNGVDTTVRSCHGDIAEIELVRDFSRAQDEVWGIRARNREQNFALNALLDPEIDFVTLLGTAGTGKTLMALAAGLVMTLDRKLYREIIMTRETVPVGEDIGFLPGTEEEKMAPWMGALMDNLELLGGSGDQNDWEQASANQLIRNRVKIRSINFMRGRTFLNRYIIIDEAQNLTAKQLKTLITRAGPGSKIVCIGNIAQIDTPYLSGSTSGLTYVVDRFRGWQHSAHITLKRGERSRLADFAADVL